MSFTYFISDLHLSADRQDITDCLLAFLSNEAPSADALYVLGDLFEYWIGDDDINDFTNTVATGFKALSETGVPIYFIHGNRDFLIRKSFAKRAGMTLLNEQEVVDLYGTPTLIMHGDELCTKDVVYQNFRKKARGWWWPRLVLSLPLSVRHKLAQRGRETSKKNHQGLTEEIMDVTPEEVVRWMSEKQVSRLIHGHTHKPNIHELVVDNQTATRIVLGDWYNQGSVLKVSANKFELSNRNLTASAH